MGTKAFLNTSIKCTMLSLIVIACRSHSQDPCLKSIGVTTDSGFAKTPGGFVVFSNRQISDDGKRLVEIDRLHRITGSFEFIEEESEGNVQYFVDVITTPNALHLGQLDRVYLDVYVGGTYLKIPIVAEEYEQVNKIFREGKKRSIDPELLRFSMSAFSQAPHALNAKAGKELSVRDYMKTVVAEELCPDDDESCLALDALRVYRFQVMLSDFHLARIYRDEIRAGIEAENIKGLGKMVQWSRAFIDQQRKVLGAYLKQTSAQRNDFLKSQDEQVPELMKAYSAYRSFQKALLDSEKQEARLHYMSRLVCFAPDSPELSTDLCEDFAEFLPETFPDFVKFSKELVEKEFGALPKQDQFLNQAKEIALTGLDSYKTLVELARAANAEVQIFSNFITSKEADDKPAANGLFFGGLAFATETPAKVTVKNQDFEFLPFTSLEQFSVYPDPEAEGGVMAAKAKWKGEGFDNLRYCFQMGSQISVAGLTILGLHGGCDQSGGAVIIPAPYTPNNDPVSSQGSVEPSDEPDQAQPDITAGRSDDKKGSFHAEDYHPNRDAALSSQGAEAQAETFSDNYRSAGSQNQAVCGQ